MKIRTFAAALVIAGSVAPAFAQDTAPPAAPAAGAPVAAGETLVLTTPAAITALTPGLLAAGGSLLMIGLASGGSGSPISTTSTTSTTSTVSTN